MSGLAQATDLIRTEWAAFVDSLAAAGPQAWDLPTRLAGWSVEDLARHVHWGVTLEENGLALAGEGRAGTAAGNNLAGPTEEIVPALRTAAASLVDRLEQLHEPLSGAVSMPYGELPMGLTVPLFVMEAAMHRSDLAHALSAGSASSNPSRPYA